MLRSKAKRDKYSVQIPLTSLIDMIFLLLIYFLLTTNFIVEEGIKVNLPNAQASVPQVKQEIVVSIDKEGTPYVLKEKIPLNMLYIKIKEMIGNDPDRLVVIKADKKVVLNKVVNVMDIAKSAGASRLSLATEKGL